MKHHLTEGNVESTTFEKWLELAREPKRAASNKSPPKQINVFDKEGKNLLLRVSAGGTKTWMLIHYDNSKPRWLKLALFGPKKKDGADRWPETGRPRYLTVAGARHALATYTADPEAFVGRIKRDAKVADGLDDSNDGTAPSGDQGEAAGIGNLMARLLKPKVDFKALETDLDSLSEADFGALLKGMGARAQYELVVYAYMRWFAAHLRSRKEIKRALDKYCYPRWHGRAFVDIAPSDVANLYHEIRNELKFPRQAQNVFAIIRGVGRWFEAQQTAENYVCRFKLKRPRNERPKARDRVLDDQEIKDMWKAANQRGLFGTLLKILLLTAQRRDKVVKMRFADLHGATWTIATEENEKGNPGILELPKFTLDLINSIPRVVGCEYVFASSYASDSKNRKDRNFHFNSFSNEMEKLRELLPPSKKPSCWTIHDLRRSARTRLADLGVADRIAETILGHTIEGVEAVYNHSKYVDQKREALQKLADHIQHLVGERPATKALQDHDGVFGFV